MYNMLYTQVISLCYYAIIITLRVIFFTLCLHALHFVNETNSNIKQNIMYTQ